MEKPIILVDRVSRHYKLGRQSIAALNGVSVAVPKGQFVAVTGRSGSGKSTLLNILGCLDRPDAGSYRLTDVDVATFDDEKASDFRNLQIGFVFQSFHLLPRLSVLENVMLPQRFQRPVAPSLVDHAKALLTRVGLSDRLSHRPSELSGGQMQRVAIARALLMKPALLLADEPTGNLDSKSSKDVLALFSELHDQGQTILLVTHDSEVASRAQREVRLSDGRIEHDSFA